MNAEERLTRKEIAERIVTGMGMVYGLFNEMNSFFRSVLGALESSDLDILPLKKRFLLPKPRKRRLKTSADDYLKTDMGFIAALGVGGIEDEDTSEDEYDGETVFEDKGISINPDSQFLAIRSILYDPNLAKTGSFVPYVVGALLSSIVRLPKKQPEPKNKKEKDFRIKKIGHLLRGMGQLEPSLEAGMEISWMIPKYTLTAGVAGIVKIPLVDFDSEENFSAFIENLIAMVESG